MVNGKITLYVLAGAWSSADMDGTAVIGVAEDINELKITLNNIKKSKAKDYLENLYGNTEETDAERFYEIIDSAGGYAKFYITEHDVNLTESLMGKISLEAVV